VSLGAVRVDQGGEGEAVSLAGEVLHVVIDRPYAPGAPVRLRLARDDGEMTLEARTIGSKRRDDARFDVRLRLVSLTREQRAKLTA
jgi:hypothetical protein